MKTKKINICIAVCLTTSIILLTCKEKPNQVPPCIEVLNSESLTQVLFADQRQATNVNFITTEAWTSTITEGADSWINFDPVQGKKSGAYSISILLEPNTGENDRTAVFTIHCGSEECNVTITQKADDGEEHFSIEEYLSRDWDLLQRARAQALTEDRQPNPNPAIQRILFVACTNTTLNGKRHTMDDIQKQFVKDVAKNYKEVVEFYSGNNVIMETDILFIDREVVLPNTNPSWVTQETIQSELNSYAPIGDYDGILVTGPRTLTNVHMGVKTAGYENLYGYAWLSLYMSTGSLDPPASYPYVIPKADEPPFLSTNVAVHEWMHFLEFFGGARNAGGLLNIIFPATHGYMGPPEFTEYLKYSCEPGWDLACYYRDYLSGNVPIANGGVTKRTGMFPLMWRISPRFLNSKAVYIMNEGNGMYLTYSGSNTTYSATPSPWYMRYNGDDKYLILTPDNRSLDISNAWNAEGNFSRNAPSHFDCSEKSL